MQKLQSLLTYMEGSWSSQRTLYLLKNQQIKTYNISIDLEIINPYNKQLEVYNSHIVSYKCFYSSLIQRKIIYNYNMTSIDNLYVNGFIHKHYNNIRKQYDFSFFGNYLKVYRQEKNVQYIEYVYFINSKFRISIILIKYNNNYIGISFHSDIKLPNKR